MDIDFLPGLQAAGLDNIAGLAAVPPAVCSRPESASMPKYHCLPLPLWCISSPCTLFLFLVNVSAALQVASTLVPACGIALPNALPWQIHDTLQVDQRLRYFGTACDLLNRVGDSSRIEEAHRNLFKNQDIYPNKFV
ncbi:hypothetical protein [Comamonas thiooxydans]|uniref:hypothetical protein n=1 Tax=Comamonas thiooxydans TaxID=363952 RepID=UPI001111CDC4